MKCAHWRHDHGEKVTAAAELARLQIHWQDSPRSGKRKRNDTSIERIVRSDSYNRTGNSNDESDLEGESATRKRRRLGYRSCHGSASAVDVIQGVEAEGLNGLPANVNTDGAFEVPVPPSTITDSDLSEASALSVGPRRSQRIREKLGSTCVITRGS